jgi:hypothetical protein
VGQQRKTQDSHLLFFAQGNSGDDLNPIPRTTSQLLKREKPVDKKHEAALKSNENAPRIRSSSIPAQGLLCAIWIRTFQKFEIFYFKNIFFVTRTCTSSEAVKMAM